MYSFVCAVIRRRTLMGQSLLELAHRRSLHHPITVVHWLRTFRQSWTHHLPVVCSPSFLTSLCRYDTAITTLLRFAVFFSPALCVYGVSGCEELPCSARDIDWFEQVRVLQPRRRVQERCMMSTVCPASKSYIV